MQIKKRGKRKNIILIEAGFEPAPSKRLRPERSALDRSAIQPELLWRVGILRYIKKEFKRNHNLTLKRL